MANKDIYIKISEVLVTFIYLIFYTFFTFLICPKVYADIKRERSYGWMDALSVTGSALGHGMFNRWNQSPKISGYEAPNLHQF